MPKQSNYQRKDSKSDLISRLTRLKMKSMLATKKRLFVLTLDICKEQLIAKNLEKYEEYKE